MIRKVKKLMVFLLNSIIIILASTQLSYALELNHTTEAIEKFEADITVNHNRIIKVTEHIAYNFGSKKHHSIFRFIPLRSNLSNLEINILSVTDNNQAPYEYTVKNWFRRKFYII